MIKNMCKTNCREGNLFWDRQNQVLVSAKENETFPPKINGMTNTAMAIPISEPILEVLGFKKNGCSYENKGYVVTLDASKYDGLWWLNGKSVSFLNNLQDVFDDLGEPLNIDDKVKDALRNVLI